MRLTLMGVLTCSLLALGILLLLQTPAQAWPSKISANGKSCMASGCHTTASGTIETAVNGARGTTANVTAGSTFEVDWRYTGQATSGNPDSASMIAVPANWTVATGTANNPTGFTTWSTTWDNAAGVGTYAINATALSDLASSPNGYAIDFTGSSWLNANGTASDFAGALGTDLDGTPNLMGADARVTVPAGTAAGTYSVVVMGAGHSGSKKSYAAQTITVTVSSGISQSITVTTPAPASAPYNSQFTVAATASSGLPVSYSSGNTGICTNSGATFTMASGTGTCIVQYDQAGGSGYNAAPRVTSNTTASKISQATVSVSAPATATFGQIGLSATASGGSGTGIYSYSAGSSTACTVNATSGALTITSGTGTCSITATRAADSNYSVSAASAPATVAISKATQATVSVSTPANAYYGQTGLSATASGGSGTGAYSYSAGSSTACTVNAANGALTITSGTGTCAITAVRATDNNYNVSATSAAAPVAISKATPTVTAWPAATAITYGQTLANSSLTGGTTSTPGAFAFTSPATAPNAGTAPQGVTFTPTDTTNYNSATGSVSVTVDKATTTVTAWPVAAAITYGQTLANSSLTGGTASTPGAFAFTTPATAPNAGTAPQGVTFTPTDALNYTTATGSVSVTVDKATPTVTVWPAAAAITYGQTLANSTLTGGTASTPGTFAFTNPATAPSIGTAPQSVTFTPTDALNYTTATGNVSVTVDKATPTVTAWPVASAITYGQTLANSTLTGGTASTPGVFAFTTPATAPNAGTAPQGVTFTPTDTTNYNSTTGSVSVTVDKANQTISFTALANKTYGDAAFTLSATGGASGNPVTFSTSNPAVATVDGTAVTIVGAGITTITASQAGNTNYNAATDAFQALTVDKANQTITFTSLPAKNVGDPDFAPGAIADSTLAVSYTSSNTAVATIVAGLIHIVGPGSTNITASQAGNTNFNAALDAVQPLTVTAGGTPTLSVTIVGNGSVNSSPSGIACTSGTCSNSTDFTSNQSVDLTAATSWNYDFAGWSGACSGTALTCTLSVNGLTEVTATFTAKQLVKLPGGNYASIQEAYTAASEGDTMQLRDQTFPGDLDFNRSVQVKLDGGWNTDYTAVTGNTTINGTVTVTSGGITTNNLIIQ